METRIVVFLLYMYMYVSDSLVFISIVSYFRDQWKKFFNFVSVCVCLYSYIIGSLISCG